MKTALLTKLKGYSLSASALIGLTNASAQVLYTDVDPDTTVLGSGGLFELDLNNDGTIDFNLEILSVFYTGTYSTYGAIGVNANPLNSNAVAVDSSSYPYALSNGATINAAMQWNSSTYNILFGSYFFAYGTYTSSLTFGNWQNVNNKYLGLSLVLSGQTHYGWARLDVILGEFTLKDYAVELTPNTPIVAGDTGSGTVSFPAMPATNLMASDVDDNGNGSDLELSFNAASSESGIDEYRAIAVKASSASTFGLSTAQQLSAARYVASIPTGAAQTVLFNAGSLDADGDPIVEQQPYRVFIMSVADGQQANQDTLSSMSNEVTLSSPIVSDTAFALQLSDIGNNGNGSDLKLEFTMAADESTVGEYRVMIVPTAQVGIFDLLTAQAVSPGNFTTVAPSGINPAVTLSASSRDVFGQTIAVNIAYSAFVLSMADGTIATVNQLSSQSNSVTLNSSVGLSELASAAITILPIENGIQLSGYKLIGAQLEMTSMTGQIIKREVINRDQWEITAPTGIYTMSITTEGKRISQKVFIK